MSIDTDKLPTDTLEQDVPVGGVDDGRKPAIAVQTVGVGISTTREVPPLRQVAFRRTLTQMAPGVEPDRIGRETRRRSMRISCGRSATASAYLILATTREQAMNGDGYMIQQGSSETFTGADAVWVAAIGAGDLAFSAWIELDQG